MTKERAIELAEECLGENGSVLDVKEYDDIFVITFVKGWDTIIVDKRSETAVCEQDLSEEEAVRIARRPYSTEYGLR